MKNKAQVPEYAGKLTIWNNPALDALCEAANEPRRRALKPRTVFPERCPGCERTALLYKGFHATLCQECHDTIKEMAQRTL